MQYPLVITLKDGKNETLFSVQDFEYLIDQYMGFESLKYFRSIMQENQDKEQRFRQAITDLKKNVLTLDNRVAELESDFDDE